MATVEGSVRVTPFMIRVAIGGPDLGGLTVVDPASSVRLLLPEPGADLVIPAWNGNEFLMPDGNRPLLRTLTPSRPAPGAHDLDLDIVLHEGGPLSEWAVRAGPGDPVAVSGPGRGHPIDRGATGYVIVGDESAIPAIAQILDDLPMAVPSVTHVEIGSPDAALALPRRARGSIDWHLAKPDEAPGARLIEALRDTRLARGNTVWAAGEAAAMQRIRRHLADDRGWPRNATTVRGYWKAGRSAG